MERKEKHELVQGADQPGQEGLSVASSVQNLLQQWHAEEQRKRLPWRTALYVESLIALLLFLLLAISPQSSPVPWWFLTPLGLDFMLMVYSATRMEACGAKLSLVQVQIKAQLEAVTDTRATVLLLNALRPTSVGGDSLMGPLRGIIIATLTRLFADLNREEAAALIHSRGEALADELNRSVTGYPDFVIAGLPLLPARPDRRGLILTAKFLWGEAPTRNEQRVREAARKIFPQLLAEVDLGGIASLSGWINALIVHQEDTHATNASWSTLWLPYLAVMQLLPRMAPADYLKLNQKVRQRLYSNLRVSTLFKGEYSLVVLDMIRRSADVEALSTLHALINGEQYTSPYPEVRETTRACIPILQAQLEREKVSKTLLRGASAPEAAAETLLRAASTVTPTDPQLLLRANVQDKSSISK
jgi:hypothetical protein